MKPKYHPEYIIILFLLMIGSSFLSCKKELDTKPSKSLEVPSTVNDLQALLDNIYIMNNLPPGFDEASADDYYLQDPAFEALVSFQRNAYLWQSKGTDFADFPNDWANIYNPVYYANVALDYIGSIAVTPNNQADWNNVKGSALFFRSLSFLRAAWIYSKAYDPATDAQDYGIVLRLTSDFNIQSARASLKETYDQIINDLKEAVPLLPDRPKQVTRPSKASAYALLARTFLSMRNYPQAGLYADSSLQLYNTLIDYNTISPGSSRPFQRFNSEVLFQIAMSIFQFTNIYPRIALVDSVLYQSYADDDIRKTAFFRLYAEPDQYNFKGSYDGSPNTLFMGIATDEVYLMRAECYARGGDIADAMADLNTLIETRWSNTSTYIPFSAATAADALALVLTERRKELIFRDLRWMDLKRFNKDGANITLTRNINGVIYTLPPNDNRYALPIPAPIIAQTGMPQNP